MLRILHKAANMALQHFSNVNGSLDTELDLLANSVQRVQNIILW